MLSEVLLIAAAGIYNPMDMSGHLMYPSGAKECDKYYNYAPLKSKNASFVSALDFYDDENDLIESGFYLAKLSQDKTKILLFQNGKFVAVFNVLELNTLKEKLTIPYINFEITNANTGVLTLFEDNYMAKAKIKMKTD